MSEQIVEQLDDVAMDIWRQMVMDGIDQPAIIRTAGISMHPLLSPSGDSVRIMPLRRPLIKGDFVVFHRDDGKYVAHRVCWFDDTMVQTLGDNCDAPDKKFPREDLLGLVTHVNRKNRLIYVDTPLWRFYGRVMIATMPVRMFWKRKVMRKVKDFIKKLLGL